MKIKPLRYLRYKYRRFQRLPWSEILQTLERLRTTPYSTYLGCAFMGHEWHWEGLEIEEQQVQNAPVGKPIYEEVHYSYWRCKHCSLLNRAPAWIVPTNKKRRKWNRFDQYVDRIIE